MALTPCIDGVRKCSPSVVLESGWWESGTQWIRDSCLWLKGMAGAVRVVVLCKTYPPDLENKIRATLTLCRIGPNGKIITTELVGFTFLSNSIDLEAGSNLLLFDSERVSGWWWDSRGPIHYCRWAFQRQHTRRSWPEHTASTRHATSSENAR